MISNNKETEKVEEEKPLESTEDVLRVFRRTEEGTKRSAFNVISEDLGGILMDEPTQTVNKEFVDELKANRDVYIADTENPLKKIFIKVFADGKFDEFLPKGDNYSFEVAVVNAHPMDYVKVFEWNVIGKFALSLENLLAILKSYSKSFQESVNKYKEAHAKECEELDNIEDKKKSQERFLKKVYELNEKVANSLLEKNDFRCYLYGVFENKETGKLTIKSNNKFLTMKTLKDKFMELDARSGYFVTDYMLLKSGIISYKEYAEAWIQKMRLYHKWVYDNIGKDEKPDALIFHMTFKYKEVLTGLSKAMGDSSIFEEDGNIFFIVGENSKIPLETRVKIKLDKMFGGR